MTQPSAIFRIHGTLSKDQLDSIERDLCNRHGLCPDNQRKPIRKTRVSQKVRSRLRDFAAQQDAKQRSANIAAESIDWFRVAALMQPPGLQHRVTAEEARRKFLPRLAEQRNEFRRVGSDQDQAVTILRDTAGNPAVKENHIVVRAGGQWFSVPEVSGGWSKRVSANAAYDSPERRLFLEPLEPKDAEEFVTLTGTPAPAEALLTTDPSVGGEMPETEDDETPLPGQPMTDEQVVAIVKARGGNPDNIPKPIR